MRKPPGVDVISGLLQVHCNKQFQNIHILDAGCGTGQHSKALLGMGIVEITLIDASPHMLAVAKEALKKHSQQQKAHIVEATFPSFPFQDNTFDAIMFNQVLHHLDDTRDGENYPRLEHTLEDARRILKNKGVLIISTTLSSTIRESIWFLQLQANIREKLIKTYPSVDQYIEFFHKHGFRCVTAMNLLNATGVDIYPNYLDPESILDEEWRQATSIFGIATDTEIKEMESVVLDKKKDGTMEVFVHANDHTHKRGLVTLFACISDA